MLIHGDSQCVKSCLACQGGVSSDLPVIMGAEVGSGDSCESVGSASSQDYPGGEAGRVDTDDSCEAAVSASSHDSHDCPGGRVGGDDGASDLFGPSDGEISDVQGEVPEGVPDSVFEAVSASSVGAPVPVSHAVVGAPVPAEGNAPGDFDFKDTEASLTLKFHGGGSLKYYKSLGRMFAYCKCRDHGVSCSISRTCKDPMRMCDEGQGKCVGLLLAWIFEVPDNFDRYTHVHHFVPSSEPRQRWRTWAAGIPQLSGFFEAEFWLEGQDRTLEPLDVPR